MSENPERLDGEIKKLITDKGRQFEADLVVRIVCANIVSDEKR